MHMSAKLACAPKQGLITGWDPEDVTPQVSRGATFVFSLGRLA